MAALGYFKSPSTGNAVTWDGSGTQTDTGIAHGEYQMPGQTGPTVVGPGPGLSPTVVGPQDPGRMYRGNDMQTQSYAFGPDGQPTATSKPIGQPTTLAEYNKGSKGPSTDGGVWLSDSSGNRWNMGGSPAASTAQAGPNNGGGSGMSGGGQSSMNLGMSGGQSSSTSQSSAGGQNPYLKGMGDNIVNQMTDNFTRNQMPAMRSGAMAAGGFGGSRQGVVDANGLKDLNQGIGQNLTNLYGSDWTNQQNRNLQDKSINNSYDLGLKSNNLGFANLDSNNQQFGANHSLNVLNAQNNWANQGVAAANQIAATPGQYQTMFGNQQNQIAGQGGTQTNTQNNPGNPWLGALGGFQLASSYLNK